MNVFDIILCIIGMWAIIFSLIVKTESFKGSIIYKVIPFFSGVYCIFYSLYVSGIIKFN